MPRPYVIPIWKKAPYLRMLLPLVAGIMAEWYFQISSGIIITALISFCIAFGLFKLLPVSLRFKLEQFRGFIIQLLFICLGALLTWQKDIQHDKDWYGHYYNDSSYLVVRIDEPLVEKNKSFKADGYAEAVLEQGKMKPCKGKLLLYFSKENLKPDLNYGNLIIIHKPLQLIKNSGNPGAFNYQRYAAFQGIFHNVFLKEKDWAKIPAVNQVNPFRQFVFNTRAYVLSVLQKTIQAGKDELNITQALLIGYTNDLDKDLVQAYSNTGVVHIIAISGMHLGLIYVLLLWVFAKIPFVNKSKKVQLLLILSSLWLFAVLTGASSSVLRAAVMFSFIAIGKNLKKPVSIYSSLAVSAFVLLCINPYYLWAVGFQLSYLAVLGIVIFQKPIYNIVYIKNKWIDKAWQLMSVSTAAQLLTFPVCIYYFHQFPNLFLVTNIVAVPLATVILYAGIALVAFSQIPYIGLYLGKLVGSLTWLMNKFILWINGFSFAVWDKIPATVSSTWILYATVAGFSAWLLLKNKKYFNFGIFSLLAFIILTGYNKIQTSRQQKLVVYNVPQHQAIDFIKGNSYQFVGDSILLEDGLLQNFHLKPGRISQQLIDRTDSLPGIFKHNRFYQFKYTRVLILDNENFSIAPGIKMNMDMIIISKNPKVNITQLAKIFNCKQFIFDASNQLWKIKKWQQECKMLGVIGYSVPEAGAFIYDVGI